MNDKTPEIIYQDDDFLVLNKPSGVIVNNSDTSKNLYTVQDFVQEKFGAFFDDISESDFVKRNGIVHRLDKETSGVLIVALAEQSFLNLQAQFKARKVKKTYIALCHGKLGEEGIINVPIGRLPWNRTHFGVIPQGRESVTEFKLLKQKTFTANNKSETLSLVEVYPKTGRTHQIRVHFRYIGHPLFGDELYAGRKTQLQDRKYLNRHFLHASKISFFHPNNSERVEYSAKMSPELVDFLAKLT